METSSSIFDAWREAAENPGEPVEFDADSYYEWESLYNFLTATGMRFSFEGNEHVMTVWSDVPVKGQIRPDRIKLRINFYFAMDQE